MPKYNIYFGVFLARPRVGFRPVVVTPFFLLPAFRLIYALPSLKIQITIKM
jgi:hypothetical protein